jgi:uncharacterized protein
MNFDNQSPLAKETCVPESDVVLPPENIPSPTLRPLHTIFRGPNGIRAGWRMLIFFALIVALQLAVALPVVLVSIIRHHARPRLGIINYNTLTPSILAISEAIFLVFPGIAAWIMARIEHCQWGQYGLPIRVAFTKNFWLGTLLGFASICANLLGISAFHGFRLTGLAIHGSILLSSTLAWSFTFILVGLAEEFSFRGYLQYTLTTGIGFWPSALLLSALFALAHAGNPGETTAGLLSIPLFALLFCLFLRLTGNLWLGVGFHAGWDWGQTFFYGVSNSGLLPYHSLFHSTLSGPRWLTGGSVGPEANVFSPIVLGVVAIAFVLTCHRNRNRDLAHADWSC